jgi:hypothetical protein
MNDREQAALQSLRESFDRLGHPLGHFSDEELLRAAHQLSIAVAHAGISVEQAFDAMRCLVDPRFGTLPVSER